MSYVINFLDGSITLNAYEKDSDTTSLTLVGQYYSGWGQYYSQNFISLLENFAGTTAPNNPISGQLWFDSNAGKLKIYSGGTFNNVAGDSSPKLTTARNIALSGAVTGNANFDGSTNITIATTPQVLLSGSGLVNQPNVAYSSPRITVDQYGRITGIENTGGDGAGPPAYVSYFNGRTGSITLTSADVTNALGYTPPTTGGISGITSSDVINALGYTPANNSLVLLKTGGTMSGTIDMNNNRIVNLPAPQGNNDPARKIDLDSVSNNKTTRVINGAVDVTYNVTVSTSAPSGGNDGDVWYRY